MPIVLKSGSLNLLEPSGPVQACIGVALKKLLASLFNRISCLITVQGRVLSWDMRRDPTVDIIRMFITMFTKACLWYISEACWIQPTNSCSILLFLLLLCQCPLSSNATRSCDLQRTDLLSAPGIKDDLGMHALSGLELREGRMRNGETNRMVRRTCDTAGLSIASCHYSGMLGVVWDVKPLILVEIDQMFDRTCRIRHLSWRLRWQVSVTSRWSCTGQHVTTPHKTEIPKYCIISADYFI